MSFYNNFLPFFIEKTTHKYDAQTAILDIEIKKIFVANW